MWTTWPKRHFLFLNQVMAPITYSHLRAPQISHTAGILQLACFLRLPCQHHWFFRLWRTQSIYVIYNKFHTCRASCIPKDQKKKPPKKPQTTDNLASHAMLQIYKQPRSDWFTSVTEQGPLHEWCMAALYTNQEQRTCLFTAAEGIQSLDFKTGESDILNNALPWEMSSKLKDAMQSTPKTCQIL